MRQNKIESLIEVVANTISGLVVTFLVFSFILAPLLGFHGTPGSHLLVTVVLTGISVLKGYFWRRLFDGPLRRTIRSILCRCGVLHKSWKSDGGGKK